MRRYCRAYPLGELRSFGPWRQTGVAGRGDDEDPRTVVYLRDDFTVVRSPLDADSELVYDAVTPAWREFCVSTLCFSPPSERTEVRDIALPD